MNSNINQYFQNLKKILENVPTKGNIEEIVHIICELHNINSKLSMEQVMAMLVPLDEANKKVKTFLLDFFNDTADTADTALDTALVDGDVDKWLSILVGSYITFNDNKKKSTEKEQAMSLYASTLSSRPVKY